MQVKCFACSSTIEAEDLHSLAESLVSHGKSAHSWPYADADVRTYTQNYVEAVERLSERVERLAEIGRITVRTVDDERLDDWLQLFDHDGFAGNPGWASCYCLEPHVPPTQTEPERPWRAVRATMVERLKRGSTFGYLAYVDNRVAGWVNASLRAEYGRYREVDPSGPDPSTVIGVSCFVVAPPYRRHGVAASLLDRVISDATDRGAAWIEGYPHNEPEESDGGHYRGPRSMYEARGFKPVAVTEKFTVMRRRAE